MAWLMVENTKFRVFYARLIYAWGDGDVHDEVVAESRFGVVGSG